MTEAKKPKKHLIHCCKYEQWLHSEFLTHRENVSERYIEAASWYV